MSTVQLAWLCALFVVGAIVFCAWGNAIERDRKTRAEANRAEAHTEGEVK